MPRLINRGGGGGPSGVPRLINRGGGGDPSGVTGNPISLSNSFISLRKSYFGCIGATSPLIVLYFSDNIFAYSVTIFVTSISSSICNNLFILDDWKDKFIN